MGRIVVCTNQHGNPKASPLDRWRGSGSVMLGHAVGGSGL